MKLDSGANQYVSASLKLSFAADTCLSVMETLEDAAQALVFAASIPCFVSNAWESASDACDSVANAHEFVTDKRVFDAEQVLLDQ